MIKQVQLTTTKPSKIYSIAIQLSQYTNTQNLKKNNPYSQIKNPNSYRLPKIIDVDQDDHATRRNKPFENIFNTENHSHVRIEELNNQKSFNIVGKKQVKAYQNKMTKKKNVVQRRNQSALSLSRYSSSVKSQNQNSLYLNKEDVLSFLRPSQNQTQNESKFMRQEQMATIGTQKSSQTNASTLNRQTSKLSKCKQKLLSYTKTWNQQKLKKTKFPSILQHIAKYRSKVEFLQTNALNQKKTFIKDKIWIQTLRTQKNVDNFYNDKYVEKIVTGQNSLMLKGKDKLKKQMDWIDEKDKAGYTFAFLDSLNIKVSKNNYKEDKSIVGEGKANNGDQSILNRTMFRDKQQSLEKSKESEKDNGINGNETILSFNRSIKNGFGNNLSSLRNPPALSKFSNGNSTNSNLVSPQKSKSIVRNVDSIAKETHNLNERLSKMR